MLLILAFIVCVAVSCAEASPIPSDPVVAEPILDAAALDQVIRETLKQFNEAEEVFAACLQNAGFVYTRRSAHVSVISDHGGLRSRDEMIRTVGYGIVNGDGGSGVQAVVRGGGVPEAQREAYIKSTSPGGECESKVNYVDIQQVIQEGYQDAPVGIDERDLADPRFIEAQNNWRRCMKSLGYQFNSTIDAFNYIELKHFSIGEDSTDRSDLIEEEVDIATADLECYNEYVDPVVRELVS